MFFFALDLLVSNYYIESKAIHAFQSEIVTLSYTLKSLLLSIVCYLSRTADENFYWLYLNI